MDSDIGIIWMEDKMWNWYHLDQGQVLGLCQGQAVDLVSSGSGTGGGSGISGIRTGGGSGRLLADPGQRRCHAGIHSRVPGAAPGPRGVLGAPPAADGRHHPHQVVAGLLLHRQWTARVSHTGTFRAIRGTQHARVARTCRTLTVGDDCDVSLEQFGGRRPAPPATQDATPAGDNARVAHVQVVGGRQLRQTDGGHEIVVRGELERLGQLDDTQVVLGVAAGVAELRMYRHVQRLDLQLAVVQAGVVLLQQHRECLDVGRLTAAS